MRKSILFPMTLLLVTSCEKTVLNVNEAGPVTEQEIQLSTRSSDGVEPCYPLSVMAFAPDGELTASQTISNAEQTLSLKLPGGQEYSIVAFSDLGDEYVLPAKISKTSAITMKSSDATASIPLQHGITSISPTEQETDVTIEMNHCVASVNVTLSQLPESCKSVCVEINNVSKGISFGGTLQSSAIAHIDCIRKESRWESGTEYLFPSDNEQTVFTITYTDGDGEHSCTVTYVGKLKGGTPYNINGTYTDGSIIVNGDIFVTSWNQSTDLDFKFGPAISPTIYEDEAGGDENLFRVSQIPTPGSVWENHIVALVEEKSDKAATLTLISLKDWDGMTAATNAATPTMAADAAKIYQEGKIGNWSIPTEEEARALFNAYNQYPIATAISQAGGDEIILQSGSENVRYLCAEATRTYSFKVNSVLNAGATSKNYHLRLVRKIEVMLK